MDRDRLASDVEALTAFAVLEPDTPETRDRVRAAVSGHLLALWHAGLLVGATPGEAFRVSCASEVEGAGARARCLLVVDIELAHGHPPRREAFRFVRTLG